MAFFRILGGFVCLSASVYAADVKTTTGMDASHLTPQQKFVTLHDGTEPPFKNAYWDNHREGIYVDAISGEPLFSSTDKFDSGTGWPSFTKPLKKDLVNLFEDTSHNMTRMEVRSDKANAHLGHLFNDGPKETGGQRFCINSSALKFIPKEEMQAKGYGKWLYLFDKK
ncbi:MAG: peptide-methionine (R)-S-oxide reductase [Pseudomonas fluorescens]|nr:MAG: peptide-methionine (R)-S-oxide reductase [Pseudomonas fluorescens]